MASTGSNLEAEIAGKIPDIKPITAANPVPNKIFPIPNTNSKSRTLDKIIEINQTKIRPIKPPITDGLETPGQIELLFYIYIFNYV